MTTTKMAALVLLKPEEIKAEQDAIKVSVKDLDQRVHANALQCILHCEKHRDTSLMRRLLIDTIPTDNSGYYTRGLIAWMQYFTPMRLKQDTIAMSGRTDDGKEQPFNIEGDPNGANVAAKAGARNTPFWSLTRQGAPQLRPMFQQSVLGKVDSAMRDFNRAVENTNEDGTPKDATKPFWDGKNTAKLIDFFAAVEKMRDAISEDDTKDIREAQNFLRQHGVVEGEVKVA